MRPKTTRLGGSASLLGALVLASCTESAKTAAPADASPPTFGARVEFTPCQGTFECARVLVPVDHAAPSGKTLSIALLRAPARKPEERLGVVLVNPGGPGISMVNELPTQYAQLRLGFPKALDRFDIVAFDWRGTGQSDAVRCVDDTFPERLRAADLSLTSDASVATAEALRTELANGCKDADEKGLLPRMDVVHAARDLDLVRQALGEETVNYLGFSYGTWLGAAYASLFPSRVRAVVLDSPVVLPKTFDEQIARRAKNRDAALLHFFDACSANAACSFHGGKAASEIAAAYDALVTKIRTPPGLTVGARAFSPFDFEAAVSDGLRVGRPLDLASALAKLEQGDATAALAGADAALGRRADGTYDGRLVGLMTVSCIDLPFAAETTLPSLRAATSASPLRSTVGSLVPFPLCVGWPFAAGRGPAPSLSAETAPPWLIVAGRYDPITLFDDAAALAQLGKNGSHVVVYEGDGHSVSLRSQCVRDAVTAFLLAPGAPATSSCPKE